MCTKKKKAQKTRAKKFVKGKEQRGTERTVRPEPRPNTASFETVQSRNSAYQQQKANKAKRKKKAKQEAARQAALETQKTVEVVTDPVPVTPKGEAAQLPMDPVDPNLGTKTNDPKGPTTDPEGEIVFPKEPISKTDIQTVTGGLVGETAVTAPSIYQATPEEAISEQERLAQAELRRQRIKRARSKQSLLRRRLERSREVGSGRRVLSGTEKELNIQSRQAGTGRRKGAGRRSLITGSTGGIGYYSRFL